MSLPSQNAGLQVLREETVLYAGLAQLLSENTKQLLWRNMKSSCLKDFDYSGPRV